MPKPDIGPIVKSQKYETENIINTRSFILATVDFQKGEIFIAIQLAKILEELPDSYEIHAKITESNMTIKNTKENLSLKQQKISSNSA